MSSPRPNAIPISAPGTLPWRWWEESVGDVLTASGGYVSAGVLAWMHFPDGARRTGFAVAIVMFALGVDRFSGCSGRAVRRLRTIARHAGWYWRWRRTLQVGAMLMVAPVCALSLIALSLWPVHGSTPDPGVLGSFATGAMLLGAVYCTLLATLRTISFHEFDMILFRQRSWLGGRTLHAPIEWTGLLLCLLPPSIQLILPA